MVKTLGGLSRRPCYPEGNKIFSNDMGFIEIYLLEISPLYRELQPNESIPNSMYTYEKLCDDAMVTRSTIIKSNDFRGCFHVRVLGRERHTGLSVVANIRTWKRICISFDPSILTISDRHVESQLRFGMTRLLNMRRSKMADMVMHVSIEYHRRCYGFYPAKNGSVDVELFPFAMVWFQHKATAELAEEAVFESSKNSTVSEVIHKQGWRLAEQASTISLQLMDVCQVKPCTFVRLDVSRARMNSDAYFYTSDIEMDISFTPYLMYPLHSAFRKSSDTGEPTYTYIQTKPVGDRNHLPLAPLADDLPVVVPMKRFALFDIECYNPRPGGFPSAENDSDCIICIAVIIVGPGLPETTGEGVVLCLGNILSRELTALEKEHNLTQFRMELCATEKDLLCKLRDVLHVQYDVDVVSGWNTSGFDWPYIYKRLEKYKLDTGDCRATYTSREIRRHCPSRQIITTTKAHGTKVSINPDSPMVIHFDMMKLIMKRFKFETYGLGSVSQTLLGTTKIDMINNLCPAWASEDEVKRREIAAYCAKDTVLPLQIWNHLLLDEQTCAVSRVTGVLFGDVLARGELWKNYSLLYNFSHTHGYILNENPALPPKPPTWKTRAHVDTKEKENLEKLVCQKRQVQEELKETRDRLKQADVRTPGYTGSQRKNDTVQRDSLVIKLRTLTKKIKRAENGDSAVAEDGDENAGDGSEDDNDGEDGNSDDVRYEGAKVLDAKVGIHGLVATCDFESLYPSIMIEMNICPSALMVLSRAEIDAGILSTFPYSGWQFNNIDLGKDVIACFQKNKPGMFPMICSSLLTERKRAKRDKKTAQDAGDKALAGIRDGEQLALKIVNNSQYGALGAPAKSAKFASLHCARAVTARGRALLLLTVQRVLSSDQSLEVVYGDTDSVMVSFDKFRPDITNQEEKIKCVFEFASKMAKSISQFIGPPINLEFEKLYVGYFLISKKRYFGYKKESLHEPAKLESKGDGSVRRSNPRYHRELFRELQMIFLSMAATSTTSSEQEQQQHINHLYDRVRSELQRALDGQVSIDEFSRTCQLKQHYAAPQAQSVVRDKIRERAPGSEPLPGDRVRFAIARPNKSTSGVALPAYMLAECSDYMEKHNIPLALSYYFKTIRTSIEQLFEIAKMDMCRIKSLFDQAEEFAKNQLKSQLHLGFNGFVGVSRGCVINDNKRESQMPLKQNSSKSTSTGKSIDIRSIFGGGTKRL